MEETRVERFFNISGGPPSAPPSPMTCSPRIGPGWDNAFQTDSRRRQAEDSFSTGRDHREEAGGIRLRRVCVLLSLPVPLAEGLTA